MSPDGLRRRCPIVVAQLEPIHREVVLSVVNALRDDFRVHLVLHPLIAASTDISELVPRHRKWITPAPRRSATRHLFRRLRIPAALLAALAIFQTRLVGLFLGARATLFTTIADPGRARVVCSLFRRGRVIHILHNAQRYTGRGRRVLEHMAANAVITDDIRRYLAGSDSVDPRPEWRRPRIPHLTSISPIAFPTRFASASIGPEEADRVFGVPRTSKREIRVGIPGSVANHRRNYPGFLDQLVRHGDLFGEAKIRFFILGRTPDTFVSETKRRGVADLVWTNEGFLPFDRLYAGIAAMDIIAFLIDASVSEAVNYNRTKASGTSILAVAFNKAVLSSDDFAVDSELRERTIWYPGPEIHRFARAVVDGEIDRAAITGMALPPEMHAARHRRAREEIVALVGRIGCAASA